MADTVLRLVSLSKTYQPSGRRALTDIDLQVERGQVYALLGPNGSGKTTALGIILGSVLPTAGQYHWFGGMDREKAGNRIGAFIEQPNFYPGMTGWKNLKLCALIKNQPNEEMERVLNLVGLYDRKDSRFGSYSLGMKQRLGLANALLGKPEVIVLDEPTNGLDPQGIAEVRDLIKQIAADGNTIILASHLLDEVEKVSTHVAVLQTGRMLYQGPTHGLQAGQRMYRLASDNLDALAAAVADMQGAAVAASNGNLEASFPAEVTPAQLNQALFQKGVVLSHLSEVRQSLEQQYLDIVNQNKQ